MTILRDWGLAPLITERNKPQPKAPAPDRHIRTIEIAQPDDWFIRGEIAKAKRAGETHHFELEPTD